MRRLALSFLFLSLTSCANSALLQRVVHQAPDLLVILDKGKIGAASFSSPYHHPASISPTRLQKVLGSVKVQPHTGLLRSIISGEKKMQPLFDSETARLMSIRLSQALAEAGPSERVNFYHTLPKNSVTDSVTSGFLLVKEERLHLRINHYKAPLRKGSHPSSAGSGIPRSEMAKFAFTLSEDQYMARRNFRNAIGLTGTDPHWLVIDYTALSSLPAKDTFSEDSPPPVATKEVEERLRTLKRLLQEGLITEEEYTEKKRSILKDF
ncbi:MAG: SHOCT domain-containing protein [Nitrospiria bacterium]